MEVHIVVVGIGIQWGSTCGLTVLKGQSLGLFVWMESKGWLKARGEETLFMCVGVNKGLS